VAAHPQRSPADAVQALRATAQPLDGIGGGTIDVAAASRALGPTAAAPATVRQKQAAGVLVLQGRFRTTLSRRLRLGSGPLLLRFSAGDVAGCSLALRSTDAEYVATAARPLGLQLAASVKAGSFSLDVRCATPKQRAYTLTASGVTAAAS